jgi:hypothetical protein
MKYFFVCQSGCGEYVVDEQTFKSFITPRLRRTLDMERAGDRTIVGARLVFKRYCPRCKQKSKGFRRATLHVLRPKKLAQA